MICPVCGCQVERDEPGRWLVECDCCGTVWVQTDEEILDRVLVGPEG